MVLMRRKDKRRGNEAEEIVVASDSSIIANKGVRSLGNARTGRFAADMRVNVGGYGRADKTWGVDHPWHQTQNDLFSSISSRDHMEDGELVKEELQSKQEVKGASRAALKKKKSKLKKMGLSPAEAAAAALADIERTKQEALAAVQAEKERREKIMEARKQKKTAKRNENIDKDIAEMVKEEEALDEALARAEADSAGGKKRKRVNRNKKKKVKLAGEDEDKQENADEEEESDSDISDADATAKPSAVLDEKAAALKRAKKEKRDAEKKERKEKKEAYVASVEEREAAKQAELDARDKIAKEYEVLLGSEITTKSGLVIRDVRLGKGKLPDVGEMCTVKYLGKLGKEGLVFGKGMLTTNYGTGSVIAGWEEGMGTMRPGGFRVLTIPSELGYGESGKGGKIPPNSTLYFEVELVRLGKRKREVVGKDEMPLPKAFQRKKIKEKKPEEKTTQKKNGGKKRRRKNSV